MSRKNRNTQSSINSDQIKFKFIIPAYSLISSLRHLPPNTSWLLRIHHPGSYIISSYMLFHHCSIICNQTNSCGFTRPCYHIRSVCHIQCMAPLLGCPKKRICKSFVVLSTLIKEWIMWCLFGVVMLSVQYFVNLVLNYLLLCVYQ